ncbi:M3 family oligoendopeptidase [Lihuaxuella thermophila]|uniref:Oligoendopeptidase, pepF/M3 family n=1 Tax=Lihuaxuella thermophila TaxID=1173111 RepID=A0A1H8IRH5_9BACL|nr:M3 family oligoendopeptidase [Lihuaxuella thermophila]SEN71164.1 oligoendopeptidase, pepF/M3 family [Lihuaxuella thermophila]
MSPKYAQTWNLDVFFEGGSDSPGLKKELTDLEKQIPRLKEKILAIDTSGSEVPVEIWNEALEELQQLSNRLHEAFSYISCLSSANMRDEQAQILRGQAAQLIASHSSVLTALDSKITQCSEEYWQQLIERPEIRPISFALREKRQRAMEKLPPEQEELVGNLSVDGYHGWGQMYNTIVGRMQIPCEENGKIHYLSVGQAFNKLSNPDRKIRRQIFAKWEEAWKNEADLFAETLNHLAGHRLQLYKHRGWDSVWKEPLDDNRMREETLRAMWEAIETEKHRLVKYLERKAKLLQIERLSWYDLHAPLPGVNKTVPYDEAADFIVEQFRHFSRDLAEFAQHAFENRWIEAEDRPGKRPGGFCASFPVSEQTRIFMTYSGTPSNVSTLAHELGHAYHQHVMKGLPALVQEYAMNVAETASTFAELIVTDAAIRHADSREERVILLEDKLQRAVSFFMDVHSRFLFETRFYEERKQGPLTPTRLCELMVEAQKAGFAHSLAEYHPHFWASKLHFYNTYVPFYNFSYTFGYLFSTGIYARALEQGTAFAQKYVDLLRDTGRMTVEDLAEKHLGVDLTKPDFWQQAVDLVLADVDEFLSLT